MPISRGEQRHIVRFENPTRTPDGEGGYTEAWAPVTPEEWFVAIRPATAADAERAQAGTQLTHVSHVIDGDYHPEVTTRTRMIFEGKVYHVTSAITTDARGLTMQLVADLQT